MLIGINYVQLFPCAFWEELKYIMLTVCFHPEILNSCLHGLTQIQNKVLFSGQLERVCLGMYIQNYNNKKHANTGQMDGKY